MTLMKLGELMMRSRPLLCTISIKKMRC